MYESVSTTSFKQSPEHFSAYEFEQLYADEKANNHDISRWLEEEDAMLNENFDTPYDHSPVRPDAGPSNSRFLGTNYGLQHVSEKKGGRVSTGFSFERQQPPHFQNYFEEVFDNSRIGDTCNC